MLNLDEDLVAIKFRSYKKCKKQLIICVVIIIIGFLMNQEYPIRYVLILFGAMIGLSSFFGMRSNKLTTEQLERLQEEELI